MGTNTSNDVLAPKNIERLEEISRISKEREESMMQKMMKMNLMMDH